ncbi:hypothetical protein [Salinactinospora qingdaonensis]|uniref:Small secreted domain n=1 Tax=Salinactinospora qingdaonensis TaxID=702744 RepID=A0ABP7G4T5_9ACTN
MLKKTLAAGVLAGIGVLLASSPVNASSDIDYIEADIKNKVESSIGQYGCGNAAAVQGTAEGGCQINNYGLIGS